MRRAPSRSSIDSPAAGVTGAKRTATSTRPEDANAFYDEVAYMMLDQACAPNSPQWFNTGLNLAYGITGPAQGHFYCDPTTGELKESENAY